MKIAFFPVGCVPFHGKTLDERPLGGTETGVIRLAKALHRKGCDVSVITELQNPPPTEPLYIPFNAIRFLGEVDAIIGVRDWQSVIVDLPAKKRFLWTGDAYDQPVSVGIGDRRIAKRIDGLLCVSQWQLDTLCEVSGFPKERAVVIRNGIDLELFYSAGSNNPARLFYSSTPYRGLVNLLKIFPAVHARNPQAELFIASGYDVYAGAGGPSREQLQELYTLRTAFEAIPGVT